MGTKDDEKIPLLPAGALEDMAAAIAARESGAASELPATPVSAASDVCPNCFYGNEFRPGRYQCRRYPPVPLFYGWKPPLIEGQPPEPIVNAVFSQMAPTSTCGEFKHRDPKKAS